MGLIMLILIGTVPTAYALNRALPDSQIEAVHREFDGRQHGHRKQGCRLQRRSAIRARR